MENTNQQATSAEQNNEFLAEFEEAEPQETSEDVAGIESEPKDMQTDADVPKTEEHTNESTKDEPEQKIKISVNGKEEELSLDELISAAQKGADYDRLKADNAKVRAHTERLSQLARKNNTTVEALIEQAEAGLEAAQFETLRQQYMDKGMDEEAADLLANKDLELARAASARDEKAPVDPKQQRDIELFNQLYPDVDAKDIPEEVFADIYQNGLTLVEAYQKHENAQLRAAAEAKQKNKENREKAIGSARDKKAEKHDAFLDAFLD